MFSYHFLLLLGAAVLLPPPCFCPFLTFKRVCSALFLPLLFLSCFLALSGACPELRNDCMGIFCSIWQRLGKNDRQQSNKYCLIVKISLFPSTLQHQASHDGLSKGSSCISAARVAVASLIKLPASRLSEFAADGKELRVLWKALPSQGFSHM